MDHLADSQIPQLLADARQDGLRRADASARRRHPNILHNPGDEFNRVVNFIMRDSYMQPHHHPGPEKIEKIYVLEGRMAVLFFDDAGAVTKVTHLEGPSGFIAVPAFTWHTYVMLTDHVISYETMMGRYEPASWKEMAQWAPVENVSESAPYLESLKDAVVARG